MPTRGRMDGAWPRAPSGGGAILIDRWRVGPPALGIREHPAAICDPQWGGSVSQVRGCL